MRPATTDICPRCEQPFGEKYPGVSRLDNDTIICHSCEISEALEDYYEAITPKELWPIRNPAILNNGKYVNV